VSNESTHADIKKFHPSSPLVFCARLNTRCISIYISPFSFAQLSCGQLMSGSTLCGRRPRGYHGRRSRQCALWPSPSSARTNGTVQRLAVWWLHAGIRHVDVLTSEAESDAELGRVSQGFGWQLVSLHWLQTNSRCNENGMN
jgi:hypothetical protein